MRLIRLPDQGSPVFLLDADLKGIRLDFITKTDPKFKLKTATYPGIVLFYAEEDLPGVWAFGKEMENRALLPSVHIERKDRDIYALVVFQLKVDDVGFLRGGVAPSFFLELNRTVSPQSILRIASAARTDYIMYERFMRAFDVKKRFLVQIAIQRDDDPALYTECWTSAEIGALAQTLPPPRE